MTTDGSDFLSAIRKELDRNRLQEAAQMLVHLHPADIAELFEALDEPEKIRLFGKLDVDTASEVIAELSEFSREQILAELTSQRLGEIVDELDSDDAADLLASVSPEMAEKVLASIDVEDSQEVRRLLAYDEETAGGIMQAELMAVPQETSVAETINRLRQMGERLEDLANIFVVNSRNQAVGQLSLQRLILADPGERISRAMDATFHPIPVDMDQEEVARIFQKYDIISAPVVESDGTLVGRITIDDIMDIVEEEISEDVLRMAGTHEDELVYGDQIWKISRFRLPWLLTTLVGGLLTGYLLWLFKVALADAIVLVTFVPVIMALGGSVAIQSTTITVRGLATGGIDLQRLGRTVYKESRVGLVMALVCGLILGIAADLWHRNPALGLTVGLAMAMVILVASLMGTLVPMIFQRLGIDPAVASGPFVTMANDISGIVIYLSISTAFMRYIVG
ncbi:MAG: magnesium transporter [Deltaproteobacteria bacterium]|nr:MAG: magnesium transporter [Deltaproteobacteria bacterium]